jgi:hypothetical protein
MEIKNVDLWYPGVPGEGSVDVIEIDLIHVRAARSIRVSYDFERNGWVISAQPSEDGSPEHDYDAVYEEAAFVPAWAPEK